MYTTISLSSPPFLRNNFIISFIKNDQFIETADLYIFDLAKKFICRDERVKYLLIENIRRNV